MLHDLDSTLKVLLQSELAQALPAPDTSVTITFSVPNAHYPPTGVKTPALNLFLYAIQENARLRKAGEQNERQKDGSVLVHRAPAWVDCQYMVTAHPRETSKTPEADEHLLLGEALRVLLRHRRLPAERLQGRLQQLPFLPRTSAVRPELLMHGLELWHSLGGRTRPSFHYTVSLPFELVAPAKAGPLVKEAGIQLLPWTPPDRNKL